MDVIAPALRPGGTDPAPEDANMGVHAFGVRIDREPHFVMSRDDPFQVEPLGPCRTDIAIRRSVESHSKSHSTAKF
jgi:hypothetical protein